MECPEIEQLFCNYLEDLTTSAVKVSIPGKTLDEVAAAVNNIHPRPRWTRKEIECLIKMKMILKSWKRIFSSEILILSRRK